MIFLFDQIVMKALNLWRLKLVDFSALVDSTDLFKELEREMTVLILGLYSPQNGNRHTCVCDK